MGRKYETFVIDIDESIYIHKDYYMKISTKERVDFINNFLNQKYDEGLELVSMSPVYDVTGVVQEYCPIHCFYMIFKRQDKQNLID